MSSEDLLRQDISSDEVQEGLCDVLRNMMAGMHASMHGRRIAAEYRDAACAQENNCLVGLKQIVKGFHSSA